MGDDVTLAMLRTAVEDQREDWRAECQKVQDAQRRWAAARDGCRSEAHREYLEALEREERSSQVLEHLLEAVERNSAPRREPTRRLEPGIRTARRVPHVG